MRHALGPRIAAAGLHFDHAGGTVLVDDLQGRVGEIRHRIRIFVDMKAGGGARREIPAGDAHPLVVNLLGRYGLTLTRLTLAGLAHLSSPLAGAAVVFSSMVPATARSEEHTSELQSLMRISYAVFCLKKKSNIYNYK